MRNGKTLHGSKRCLLSGLVSKSAQWLLTISFCAYAHSGLSEAESFGQFLGISKGTSMQPEFKQISEFREDDDIASLEFSPDGAKIAVSTFLKLKINLWDWRKPKITKTYLKPPVNFDYESGDAIRFSPDGHLLAVSHGLAGDKYGGSVARIFDTSSGAVAHEMLRPLGGGVSSRTAFSPDGKLLYLNYDSQNYESQFASYSTDSWTELWTLRTAPLHVQSLAISPDGKLALLGGYIVSPDASPQPQILLVDITQKSVLRKFDDAFAKPNSVQRLDWNPDGVHFAIGGRVGGSAAGVDAVRILDVRTGQTILKEDAAKADVLALRYTPDGRYLIESGIDGAIHIWNGQHTKLMKQIANNDGYAVAISRDSRYLAISKGSTATVWEMQ